MLASFVSNDWRHSNCGKTSTSLDATRIMMITNMVAKTILRSSGGDPANSMTKSAIRQIDIIRLSISFMPPLYHRI